MKEKLSLGEWEGNLHNLLLNSRNLPPGALPKPVLVCCREVNISVSSEQRMQEEVGVGRNWWSPEGGGRVRVIISFSCLTSRQWQAHATPLLQSRYSG